MLRVYDQFHLGGALCPTLGQEFQLRGKFTSELYSDLNITIMRCNASTDATCMSDANFAAF